MNRRTLLYGLAVSLVAAPVAVEAQQEGRIYRVGVLTNVPPGVPEVSRNSEAFRQGLHERGWVEGRNIVIEYRFAEGRVEKFSSLATELVSLKPDVIVALPNVGAHAVKHATTTIPIVMLYVFDPVGDGLVASLARPGGNATGLTPTVSRELVGKQFSLLKEVVPTVSHVAVLSSARSPVATGYLNEVQAAARALAVKFQIFELQSISELEDSFAAMNRERVNALLVLPYPLTFAHAGRIADLSARSRLPAMYHFRESVEAGGLMANAANAPDMFRRAAIFVDKILKGVKPGDLPVEQPTKFELVINLKAAKALGLTIPPSLLLRADQVVE